MSVFSKDLLIAHDYVVRRALELLAKKRVEKACDLLRLAVEPEVSVLLDAIVAEARAQLKVIAAYSEMTVTSLEAAPRLKAMLEEYLAAIPPRNATPEVETPAPKPSEVYTCYYSDRRGGIRFWPHTAYHILAESVTAAARKFAEGQDRDWFFVGVVDPSGVSWTVHVSSEMQYFLSAPEQVERLEMEVS